MRQLGLSVEPEHYFDICPWQTLAVINLEFIFGERRRNYLKFAGGLCYFEVSLDYLLLKQDHMLCCIHTGGLLSTQIHCSHIFLYKR